MLRFKDLIKAVAFVSIASIIDGIKVRLAA